MLLADVRDALVPDDVSEAVNKGVVWANNNTTTYTAETIQGNDDKTMETRHRARGDLLLAISFLCMRVSMSTMQDQEKLQRVLE